MHVLLAIKRVHRTITAQHTHIARQCVSAPQKAVYNNGCDKHLLVICDILTSTVAAAMLAAATVSPTTSPTATPTVLVVSGCSPGAAALPSLKAFTTDLEGVTVTEAV